MRRARFLFMPLASGSSTITATASQTLSNVTQTATGTVTVAGTQDATLGAFTNSATAAVTVVAQQSSTLDNVTQTATGLVNAVNAYATRINWIRNNTMQGAAAGTPGALPTGWSVENLGPLSYEVVGTGVDGDVEYVDLRIFGTNDGTAFAYIHFAEVGHTQLKNSTDDWTLSVYLKRTINSGSSPGTTRLAIAQHSADGTLTTDGATISVSLGSTLTREDGSQVSSFTGTYIRPGFRFTRQSTLAYDFTLRIGLPQLEIGTSATGVIRTTNAVGSTQDVAAFTQTSTGAVTVSGSQGATLDNITQTATAVLVNVVQQDATLPAFTQTATVAVGPFVADQTLSAPTQTAAAVAIVVAQASQTLSAPAQTAEATAAINAAASQTLPNVTQTATAAAGVVAQQDATLSISQTATAAAVVTAQASQSVAVFTNTTDVYTGTSGGANQAIAAFSQTATGAVVVAASVSQQVDAFIASQVAIAIAKAQAAQTLSQIAQTAAVDLLYMAEAMSDWVSKVPAGFVTSYVDAGFVTSRVDPGIVTSMVPPDAVTTEV